MEKRMDRFWQSAIGSCLVGTSLVATGCGIDTASAAPVEESVEESAVGLDQQGVKESNHLPPAERVV